MSTKALRGLNLHKRYRDKIAVNDVSIDVQQCEVVGLLEPNGAGKTTCFTCLLVCKMRFWTSAVKRYGINMRPCICANAGLEDTCHKSKHLRH